MKFSRREFAKTIGATALCASENSVSGAVEPDNARLTAAQNTSKKFPNGFLWRSATAAYQVEGAVSG